MLSSLGQTRLLSEIFQERIFLLEEIWLMIINAQARDLLYSIMRQQEGRGRRNWQKLKNIVRSGTLTAKGRQRKFQLFERQADHRPDHLLTVLSLPATPTSPTVTLFQKSPLPLYKELLHFAGDVDATGRWVWEAEEVAAYYFLQTGEAIIADVFMRGGEEKGQARILEVGAGSSGLAGLALWQVATQLKGVHPMLQLTDGEPDNIRFLQENLALNNVPPECGSARQLLWGGVDTISNLSRSQEQRQVFEVIIICDCLYFETFHKQLLLTIESYLSPGGCAFLVNPARGHSMSTFLDLAAGRGFEWEHLPFEDEKYQMQFQSAREGPAFEEDKHALFFTKLCRKMIIFHS